MKVYYTGPVTTCAGTIRVFENAISFTPVAEVAATSATATAPTANGLALATFGSPNGGVASWAPINTTILAADFNQSPNPTPDNVVYRPEEGVLVRHKHRTGKYNTLPIPVSPYGVTSFPTGQSVASPLGVFNLIGQTATFGGGLAAYDNDWVGNHIIFDNVNPDASFAVETCLCVEFVPGANSTFAPLAKESGPRNQQVTEHVEQVLKSEGISKPLAGMRR